MNLPRILSVAAAPVLVLVAIACGSDATVITSTSTGPAAAELATGTPSEQSDSTSGTAPSVAPGGDESIPADPVERQAYLDTVQRMMDVISPTARMLGGLAIQISTAEDGAPGFVAQARVSKDTVALALDTIAALDPPADLEELHSTILESISSYLDASDVLVSDSEFTFDAYSEFQSLMSQAGGQFHDASSLLADAQR